MGTVKRAFELAPLCVSVEEIRVRLKKEGFTQVEEHLGGSSIRMELRKLLAR